MTVPCRSGQDVDLVEAALLPTPGLELVRRRPRGLLEQLLLPLAAQAVLDHVDLDRPLVAGGPSAADRAARRQGARR